MEDKAEYKAQEEETKWQSFRKMLWNSETKEYLGRTGFNWFRLTIFYIIFYAFLAAFWICMLVVFYQTLPNDQPKWTLDASRIGSSPGLGFRPSPPDTDIDSTLIWFDPYITGAFNYWVENLEKYLERYGEIPIHGSKYDYCNSEETVTPDRVFHFPIPTGIQEICSKERKFGYPEGKPCVLIKLNRIFNWVPQPYFEAPAELQKHLEKRDDFFMFNYVYITCNGEDSDDRDNIGEIRYYPSAIPHYYFPFTNQKGYVSPFVFAQFNEINRGVLVNIECRAWAANINFDRRDRLGSIHFQLLVD